VRRRVALKIIKLGVDTKEVVARHLNNEPVLARPPNFEYTLATFARRHQAGVGFGAALAGAILAGSGLNIWQAIRARLGCDDRPAHHSLARPRWQGDARPVHPWRRRGENDQPGRGAPPLASGDRPHRWALPRRRRHGRRVRGAQQTRLGR